MIKTFTTFAIWIAALSVFAQSGSITNVNSSQRTDGSMIIDVYYDLSGSEPEYSILPEVTFDGGATFQPVTDFSGDAGPGITPGAGKQIVWNFGAEYPDEYSDQVQIRLTGESVQGWTCGQPLMVTHTAGNVAPETKTVAYGTAASTLSGEEKCWITQNLGASQQAGASDDDSEAAAGWYWQFNKKQGYKHDGVNRIPGDTWDPSISNNSDWSTGQDPCRSLLGNGWRVPTKEEWENVDANGGWENYNDAFASALKLHAAGYLDASNGDNLYYRGVEGNYWSSTKESKTQGWFHYIKDGSSNIDNNSKSYGYSVRCIKD